MRRRGVNLAWAAMVFCAVHVGDCMASWTLHGNSLLDGAVVFEQVASSIQWCGRRLQQPKGDWDLRSWEMTSSDLQDDRWSAMILLYILDHSRCRFQICSITKYYYMYYILYLYYVLLLLLLSINLILWLLYVILYWINYADKIFLVHGILRCSCPNVISLPTLFPRLPRMAVRSLLTNSSPSWQRWVPSPRSTESRCESLSAKYGKKYGQNVPLSNTS